MNTMLLFIENSLHMADSSNILYTRLLISLAIIGMLMFLRHLDQLKDGHKV